VAVGLTGVVVLTGVAYWFLAPRHAVEAAIRSVAVLPFVNLSSDPQNEYFSDGLTEELINALGRVDGLRLVARGSSFQFTGKAYDVRSIGKQLDVGAVLEGSVRKENERVRISAQLSRSADGYQLWSQTYERELKDLLAIQEDIAQAIVNALRIRLGNAGQTRLVKRYTENVEAHSLYMRGQHLWYSSRSDPKVLANSIELFQQAIMKDPAYAPAYAAIGRGYMRGAIRGMQAPKELFPKAKLAVEKALNLDSSLGEAHAALGDIKYVYEWDWPGAEIEFKRALELDANSASALESYMRYLVAMGRTEESLATINRLMKISPLDLSVALSWIYSTARQYDRAIEIGLRAIALDPGMSFTHGLVAGCYVQKGMYREAISGFRRADAISPDDPTIIAGLGLSLGFAGEKAEARKMLERLEQLSLRRYVSAYRKAEVYMGMSDKDRAFQYLEKAYDDRDGMMTMLNTNPALDPLRSDPRFAVLVHKMGFPRVLSAAQ
jgi:TolB-like protein/Tfp pilus assembly protein PilF